MKYRDRNTLKTNFNFQKKIENNSEERREKNILKYKFIHDVFLFSKTIDDKFWWNSLTKKEQKEVYTQYCNFDDYYYYDSNHKNYFPMFTWENYTDYMVVKPKLSPEEHKIRIDILKEKFSNKKERRNLVINELLS